MDPINSQRFNSPQYYEAPENPPSAVVRQITAEAVPRRAIPVSQTELTERPSFVINAIANAQRVRDNRRANELTARIMLAIQNHEERADPRQHPESRLIKAAHAPKMARQN